MWLHVIVMQVCPFTMCLHTGTVQIHAMYTYVVMQVNCCNTKIYFVITDDVLVAVK